VYDGADADAVAADQCDSPENNSPTVSGTVNRIISGLPTGSPVGDEALSFSGAGYYYYQDDIGGAADNLDLNGTDHTIGCWVLSDNLGWEQTFLSKYNWTPDTYGWKLNTTIPGLVYGQSSVDSTNESAATALSTATWYHVAERWMAATDEVEIFLNGEIDCTGGCASNATGPTASVYDFIIGGYDGGIQLWNGDIYECLVFSEGLTDFEICEWCRNGGRGNATDRGATCGSCTWF
jgi:hypothetical protein